MAGRFNQFSPEIQLDSSKWVINNNFKLLHPISEMCFDNLVYPALGKLENTFFLLFLLFSLFCKKVKKVKKSIFKFSWCAREYTVSLKCVVEMDWISHLGHPLYIHITHSFQEQLTFHYKQIWCLLWCLRRDCQWDRTSAVCKAETSEWLVWTEFQEPHTPCTNSCLSHYSVCSRIQCRLRFMCCHLWTSREPYVAVYFCNNWVWAIGHHC